MKYDKYEIKNIRKIESMEIWNRGNGKISNIKKTENQERLKNVKLEIWKMREPLRGGGGQCKNPKGYTME